MVRFFSAGHGDAALIRTPAGHAVLIDAGRGNDLLLEDDLSTRRLIPYFRREGIHRLQAFVITHPHLDHIGSPRALAGAVTLERIYLGGDGWAILRPLLQTTLPAAVSYSQLKRGDTITIDRLLLKVLHPPTEHQRPPRLTAHQENNRSLVILATYGRVRFLFTGDVTSPGEARLVAARLAIRADVLKLGHHGVGGATRAFLRAVRPWVAVASCGDTPGRRWDRPRANTLRRLARQGIRLLRTDQDGDVVFFTDGTMLRVETHPDLAHLPSWAPADRRQARRKFLKQILIPNPATRAPVPRK